MSEDEQGKDKEENDSFSLLLLFWILEIPAFSSEDEETKWNL